VIYNIVLENDEAAYSLVLEDDDGSHIFRVDPQMLHDALAGWREHMAEGERVRQEYRAAGQIAWAEALRRTDPEFVDEWEAARENADHSRKAARENAA
jgi:hypothetical protein